MAKRQAVVVLGMHRSGTSATGGVMSLLGAREPLHLMPATPANPKGYWESLRLMKLHDELLNGIGSAWDDWLRMPEGWLDSAAAKAFCTQAPATLDEEFSDAGLILLKDPRMCRMMPLWESTLEEQNIEPLIAFTVRNAMDTALSLSKRDDIAVRRGLLLWLRHVLDAEHDTRSSRRTFLNYDDLLSDWRSQVARMSGDLDIDWPRTPDDAASDIEELLDRSLRHHKAEPVVPEGPDDHVISWVADATDAFDTLCRPEADTGQALATLDRVRDQFDHAIESFREAIRDEVDQFRIGLAYTRTELQRAHHALEAERKAVYQLSSTVADTRSELNQAQVALEAQHDQATAAREQQVSTQAELDEERRISADQAARLADLEATLVVMHRRAEERIEELAMLTQRMINAESRLGVVSARKKRQVAKLEARAARGKARLAEVQAELAAVQQSTSWRMTEPLRSVSGRVRGVLGSAKPTGRG